MSEDAFESFREAREAQYQRNEARRILTRVLEARDAPQVSAARWPFELLQNAIDSGPRDGREVVEYRLQWDGAQLVVEHDGKPFAMDELAALLSGGSSKDFESERTTGRFGTGFLVTHVLSVQTVVAGVLTVGSSFERFELLLDRSGSEEDILRNIERCNDAVRSATRVEALDDVWSASFSYRVTEAAVVTRGVTSLRSALPYVYGTSPMLGEVRLRGADGQEELWRPGPVVVIDERDGLYRQHRDIEVRDSERRTTYRVIRFSLDEQSAALVLLVEDGDTWRVVPLEPEQPRVYRQYPLRLSTFLPTTFVIDGRFEPDQERAKVLMTDKDRAALDSAFQAAARGVAEVVEAGHVGPELLGFARRVEGGFESEDSTETDYWNNALRDFAAEVAKVEIVRSRDRSLPATGGERVADFIVPRFTLTSLTDETTMERLHPLADRVRSLDPPVADLSETWTLITNGWHDLGVSLNRLAVSDLASSVSDGVTDLSDLDVEGDPLDWLARFIDIVGECWTNRGGVDTAALDGLLPDQRGVVRNADRLRRDSGIDDALKDVAERAGLDPRSSLLSAELTALADGVGAHASEALRLAIPEERGRADVVRLVLDHLRKALPEGPFADERHHLVQLTADVLRYLWATGGVAEAPVAHEVPLLSRDRIVHWSVERQLVPPVELWPEAAQPFAIAYPPNRVLADVYADEDVTGPLVAWGMSHAGLLVTARPSELRDQRLAAIAMDEHVDDAVVRDAQVSQIALLQPELLNRCQEELELARALLGFVLCFVAQSDDSWRTVQTVNARRKGSDVTIAIRPALWLADIRSKAWVPIASDEQRPSKAIADAATLRSLLDPAWLEGNESAVELLTTCFGFDELDLRLLGIPEDVQQAVRHDLARVLEAGGTDPSFYANLADQVEQRQIRERDVNRLRRLGLAVQDAVRCALESHGVVADFVDCGFDFEVYVDAPLEDSSLELTVGRYLVEVKATSYGPVRLTPMQAQTSAREPERFALCVVDLRSVSHDRLDGDWTREHVEPLIHMVPGIGTRVATTWGLVDEARRSKIGLRNDANLRYEVPVAVWEPGPSLAAWIAASF